MHRIGTSQESRTKQALLPEHLKIDNQSISTLLAYTAEIAEYVNYYDDSHAIAGNWSNFFQSDISVFIAKIIHTDLENLEKLRLELLTDYSKLSNKKGAQSTKQRYLIVKDLLTLIVLLVQYTDFWQVQLKKLTTTPQNQAIKFDQELVNLIQNKLVLAYQKLNTNYVQFIEQGSKKIAKEELIIGQLEHPEDHFSAIWFQQSAKAASIHMPKDLLKDAVLIFEEFYNSLTYLQGVAKKYFEKSLDQKNDHSPQNGLFITFLHLYQHLQDKLNLIPQKHLDYYYREVLQMRPRPPKPDQLFLYFEPGEFDIDFWLPAKTELEGLKDEVGRAPIYQTDQDLLLSKTNLAELKTLFVSKNVDIVVGSKYRLITNIFAAPIANSKNGLGQPFDNPSKKHWPPFGESQLHKNYKSMTPADIGLVIASPVLFLEGGERSIDLVLEFQEESTATFKMLIDDISSESQTDYLEVFFRIFHDSLKIQLSSEKGWIDVKNYEIVPTKSGGFGSITIQMNLLPSEPAVTPLDDNALNSGFSLPVPAVKITLENKGSNYIYSFWRDLELETISIDVEVKNIQKLDLYNQIGPVDENLPFQPFGPVPMPGAYLAIGFTEAFKKPLTGLSFHLEWLNLPRLKGGFKTYYKNYGDEDWDDDSFKLKLTALSKNRFQPGSESKPLIYDMFKNQDDHLQTNTTIEEIDLDELNIIQEYDLKPPSTFDNTTKSGFFKLEFSDPPEGFGTKIFPRVYTQALTKQASSVQRRLFSRKKEVDQPIELPNEPYIPVIKSLSLNYKSSTKINLSFLAARDRNRNMPEYIYHIHPFGYKKVYEKGSVFDYKLLPQYEADGYLYIGLENVRPNQNITIYFEFSEPFKGYTKFMPPTINWEYLKDNDWLPLNPEYILSDGTIGFTKSGIFNIIAPENFNYEHSIIGQGLYWLRAVAVGNPETLGYIRLLKLHAVSASWVEDSEFTHHLDQPLPAGSVTRLVNEIPEIREVFQPFPSFGGRAEEHSARFFTRVSERLAHQDRGITVIDIEKLVLQAFPDVAQVKCITRLTDPEEPEIASGQIIVVIVPKVPPGHVNREPIANHFQLNQIRKFLIKRVSPFVNIEVRNPTYDRIKIKCDIIFSDPSKSGALIQLLNNEINRFLSPSLYGQATDFEIGGSLDHDKIINFIEQRPYVEFVTKFSMIQVIQTQEGDDELYWMKDTANELVVGMDEPKINAFKPWSVLVPFEMHDLFIAPNSKYQKPKVSAIETLEVGSDFIVRPITQEEKDFFYPPPKEPSKSTDMKQDKKDNVKAFNLNFDLDAL